MKWIAVPENPYGKHFELKYEDKTLVHLIYSEHTHTTRVESGDSKRLFFIEKKGFSAGRMVIKNEYGIQLGEIIHDARTAHTGYISLDNKKFVYRVSGNNKSQIILWDEQGEKQKAICEFPFIESNAATNLYKTELFYQPGFAVLLTGICWFLGLPVNPFSTFVSAALVVV